MKEEEPIFFEHHPEGLEVGEIYEGVVVVVGFGLGVRESPLRRDIRLRGFQMFGLDVVGRGWNVFLHLLVQMMIIIMMDQRDSI